MNAHGLQLRIAAVTVAATVCSLSRTAGAVDFWVNPGTMAPNALPTYPGESPWVEPRTTLRLGAAYQLTWRSDHSTVPFFRLEAPFGKWLSLISEGIPVEFWSVSNDTARDWAISERRGISKGDLRFGAKVLAIDGGDRWPSLALRQITKTTTGKSYATRRFTNAPAYLLDGILGYRVVLPDAGRIELWAAFGFFAWQQGANGQNDAFTWNATVAWRANNGGHVRAEVRGYTGWQEASAPRVVSVGGEWPFSKHIGGYATANVGLRDAPALDAHLGITVWLPPVIPLTIETKKKAEVRDDEDQLRELDSAIESHSGATSVEAVLDGAEVMEGAMERKRCR